MALGMALTGPGMWTVFIENLGLFFDCLLGTLKLAAISVGFGTLIGAIVCLGRMSKLAPLRAVLTAYVEIIRGTPILAQLYIFAFVVPMMTSISFFTNEYNCVVIALIINSSAYVSEVFRSGIQAVDKGQMEAAKSLGMSDYHMMTRIILPQAVKTILPSLGNEFIMMIKETSLASTFFITELMYARTYLMSTKFLTWQPIFIIAIIYFVITFTLSKLVGLLEKRLAVSD